MRRLLSVSTSALALVVGATGLVGTAAAQEETIVVTGSRIARDPNLVAPQPVQSVSDEDVTLSGDISISCLKTMLL